MEETAITSGQKWCGLDEPNPTPPSADQIKQEVATAVDTLERWVGQIGSPLSNDERMLYERAKADLLSGQMMAVKLFAYN